MLLKSFYRNTLSAEKLTQLLAKIADVSVIKKNRFVLRVGHDRLIRGNEVQSFAIDPDADTDTVVVTTNQVATPGAASSLEVEDITYTAVEEGEAGDDISIEYLDTGAAGAEEVTVTDKKISVSMEAGVSTAQQISDAISNEPTALALVSLEITGTAGDAQAAAAEANLAGGADPVLEELSFDKADIVDIRRLRTKKYMIVVAE